MDMATVRLTSQALAPPLARWVEGFILAKRAEARSPRTVRLYADDLRQFTDFCESRNLNSLEAIDASLLREYLLGLAGRKLADTTIHQHYRVLRAFLRWYGEEAAGEGWRNPIDKVKPPRVDIPPLDPADPGDVGRLLACCKGRNGARDRAILLTLADAGLRAGELVCLMLADFDQVTGALNVTRSKSRKARAVFLGKKARMAVRAYLRERGDREGALFLSDDPRRPNGALSVEGLRHIVKRRAAEAGVKPPKLHAFRRAVALALVRNGADLLTVARILGHSGLNLLQRYVKQDASDLREAAERFSPGDRL